MNRFFLGGTCAETTWRDELIEELKKFDCEWFNPVVDDWTPECQQIEENEKNNKCNVHLYVITPEIQGVYSIAEIVNSCWQAQVYGTTVSDVVFCVIGEWNEQQLKSFNAMIKLCDNIAPGRFHGNILKSIKEVVKFMAYEDLIRIKKEYV